MADSNRPLSQAEIDALLSAIGSPEPTPAPETPEVQSESAPHTAKSSSTEEIERSLPPLQMTAADIESPALRRIVDLPVTFQASLGDQAISVKNLLNWGVGSQFVLNHRWQSPVPLKINGMLVGQGTVVLVGNNFGIRVSAWGNRSSE